MKGVKVSKERLMEYKKAGEKQLQYLEDVKTRIRNQGEIYPGELERTNEQIRGYKDMLKLLVQF